MRKPLSGEYLSFSFGILTGVVVTLEADGVSVGITVGSILMPDCWDITTGCGSPVLIMGFICVEPTFIVGAADAALPTEVFTTFAV